MPSQNHHASTAGILPFPTARCRPPCRSPAADLRSNLAGFFAAADLAAHVAAPTPDELDAHFVEELARRGGGRLAQLLEDNTAAIAGLRAVLAVFVEADRRIAGAADRVLTAAGLPSTSVEAK